MALALAGGWFTSSIIPNLEGKVMDYLNSNYNLHEDAKDLLETLTNNLMTIKATVDVVESSITVENRNLNEWLKKLKLIAYEAEDLIDTFQVRAIEATIKAENKVSNFASSSLDTIKNVLCPDEDLKQLEKITKKFNEVSGNIGNMINLVNLMKKDMVGKQGTLKRRETISLLPDEMELIGRENELSFIMDLILDSTNKPETSRVGAASSSNTVGLIVIPIVGLGGVGKTALAQVVYNNQQVKDSFPLRAWVYSSDNSDIKILIEKTIQNLSGNLNSNMMSLEYVTRKLTNLIKNRKFFLVFDDVSKKIEDQWDVLYTTLSCGAPRSIVIVTTQNRKFADRVATLSPIVLDSLDWEAFLKLFCRHTFGNGTIMEEKKVILGIIAEKLHGLPLAAKIIGNLLRFKIDDNEWKRISKSEWWNIREGVDEILPSVGLNYEYLKPSLRQCFAYCSVFPKNYLFHKDRLVQMWIAHNFIPINNDGVNRLEDTGRQWFDELVEHSFLQPAWDNTRFVMHNLMHDLAIAVSSDECFLLTEDTIRIPQNVRHLALQTDDPEALQKIHEFKQLRTILYFGHCKTVGMYDSINEILYKSKNVRVLDLSHMHMQKRKPPIGINELSHLRFLDLSSTGIELLSSSSFEHYYLQTIYLQDCKFTQLPENMNNLINLRHLYASTETTGLIHWIGKLTGLQELNEYSIGTTDGHRVTQLKKMNEISGKLIISRCENVRSKEEAEQAKLTKKKHLTRVEFENSPGRIYNIDKEILEGLEPYKGITDLLINNYMSESFPNWMVLPNSFSNLKYCEIRGCTQINSLPSLGQLPSLNVLRVMSSHSVKYIGDEFYGNTQIVFPALKQILFSDMQMLEYWTQLIQVRQFCLNLSKVELVSCRNLKNAPLLSFRTTLKELHIATSDHLNSLSECLQNLNSLTVLNLVECTMMLTLVFHNLPMLENLCLKSCPEIQTQGSIQSLANLQKLEIGNCPNLFSLSIPESSEEQKNKRLKVNEEGLRSLTYLNVDHSLLHQNYPLILGKLPSLQILHYKHSKSNQFTIEQDAWFHELISLKELIFSFCDFEHLPSSLTTLPSLKKMTLNSCIKLISFQETGVPSLLRELYIRQCSLELNRRCQPSDGVYWPRVSHVPYINIDNKMVQKK